MSLHETTDLLLSNTDKASVWLTLADKYMAAYVDSPRTFVLPKAYHFLAPLIELYAYDLKSFTAYVRGIRDSVPHEYAQWDELQKVYRRVNGRYTQQVRRERANKAVAKAEELYGETTYHNRQKWVSDLESEWARARLAFLKRANNGERIPHDERNALLEEFWEEVDDDIALGKGIPPWDNP